MQALFADNGCNPALPTYRLRLQRHFSTGVQNAAPEGTSMA